MKIIADTYKMDDILDSYFQDVYGQTFGWDHNEVDSRGNMTFYLNKEDVHPKLLKELEEDGFEIEND